MTPETNFSTALLTPEEEIQQLREKVNRLEQDKARLAFQVEQLRRMVFGSQSEKTRREPENANQLSLFEVAVQEEPEPEEAEVPEEKPAGKRRGRRPVPRHLETKELVIEAPEEKKVDARGERLCLLGYEVSERLNLVPGKLQRIIIKREKWGYRDSRDLVYTAEPPKAIVPKGKLTDEFIRQIVFKKFFMATPLYRQLQAYNAQGADLAKTTLSDAVKAFAAAYEPVYRAMRRELFQTKFIHGDETPIKCQGLKPGVMRQTYFWVFRHRDVCYFHHALGRGAEDVKSVFDFTTGPPPDTPYYHTDTRVWKGYVLTDGYAAYDTALKGSGVKRMACWAHVRRKFFHLKESEPDAAKMVLRINRLYRVERELGEQAEREDWTLKRFYDERTRLRQTQSKELVEQIADRVYDLLESHRFPPSCAMHEALDYAGKLMPRLKVFLADGELPMDNNAVERTIRPAVIGRKNYLFLGSEDAGHWAAVCYSLMETCRLLNMDPRDYLAQATPALLEGPTDPATLTPRAMSKKNLLRHLPTNIT